MVENCPKCSNKVSQSLSSQIIDSPNRTDNPFLQERFSCFECDTEWTRVVAFIDVIDIVSDGQEYSTLKEFEGLPVKVLMTIF